MMLEKIRRDLSMFCSKFSLMVIFTFSIYLLILSTLAIASIVILIMLKLGALEWSFYQYPKTWLIFIFVLSAVIGTVTTMMGSRLAMRLLSKVLTAMKQLANGNFDVRIKMNGLMRPRELVEFTGEFNEMAKELGSIEMLRSDFVNNFSHEFKTPIVSLRGFAKLLKEEKLTPEERDEYLDIIISESDRLTALATNVLNLSKIENQNIVNEKTTFNLSEQIRRVILMMESKWSEKNLELDVDMEEINYFGNSELLNQVWFNLADNAIKFSPSGSPLKIKLSESESFVIFEIQDHGCGMDDSTREHMFDKFYQGNRKREIEGNGLGMTVVNKIVNLHRGSIFIDSEPNQGTLIRITLPKVKNN